jgi:hypothetical protein
MNDGGPGLAPGNPSTGIFFVALSIPRRDNVKAE